MKRRTCALILCLILLFTFCGIHACCGAHCAFCALIRENRRMLDLPLMLLGLFALKPFLRAFMRGNPHFDTIASTPVRLKVLLTD